MRFERAASLIRRSALLSVMSCLTCGLGCKPGPVSDSDTTPPASGGAAPEVNRELQGKILVDGSSTVFPISEAAASAFRDQYPNVNITVGSSGTGSGFKRFLMGQIEISDASRPITPQEFEEARGADLAFVEIPIAYDGLTIVVHKQNNWVDQLTVDELKQIFTAGPAAKTWSQVRAGWPETPIAIFAPGTASGTFDYFKEVIAGKTDELRSDMSTSEDDNVLVTGVSGSPEAIGFFGVAYYEENRDKLKAVPIVNPETGEPVLPTAKAIESGEYAPFSRPLFLYVRADTLRRPDVKRFVDYYIDNAAELASSTGYVALPTSVYDQAKKVVRARQAGTHYVTEEGEKPTGPVTEVYQDSNRVGF